jgi:ElaB/YqjD/DUF883 family membrane-anchored ribosome-binding protein
MERDILGSVREGMKAAGDRGEELAEVLADRVEDALEQAEARGRRLRKQMERHVKTADRVGRDNAFLMALAALAVGLAAGWLIGRERR